MKPTIIAIVGDSGSGKTHISRLLQNELNIFQIVSHTTRPKREGEIHGVDYFFIDKCPRLMSNAILNHTKFGEYDYFALKDQVPPQGLCFCIVDEAGAKNLKRQFQTIALWVECSPDNLLARGASIERIQRDLIRERLPNNFYDFTINNNGTIEEFDLAIYETFKKIQQWQHQK